jgi:hypothetical protein
MFRERRAWPIRWSKMLRARTELEGWGSLQAWWFLLVILRDMVIVVYIVIRMCTLI